MKTFLQNIPVKRILRITAVSGAVVLVLLLAFLAFLPSLVSSQSVQKKLLQTLSSSMKRQVAWSGLAMTWGDGLTLSGLMLGDGPAPLLKAGIEQIVIVPGLGRGPDGRFGVDLTLRVRNGRLDLAPGPQKPPPPPSTKDPLTLLAETIQKVQGFDIPLPLDVRVMVDAAPLQIAYHAPAPARQLRLEEFSFRFAMPSLTTKPVTAELNGRVSVDDKAVGKISLNAGVSGLVTRAHRIRPAAALFDVAAAAPGTVITLSGGLDHADGFAGHWQLDLPSLLAIVHPFVPPSLPKLTGKIDLQLKAKSDARRDLDAALTIDGSSLTAAGGSLKEKRVGPLDVRLQQQVTTDHQHGQVAFPGGSLVLPGLIDAAWSASVKRPSDPGRTLDAAVGPLKIDLARTLAVAAPFLPPDSPLKDVAGDISLRRLSLHLNGPRNNGDLAVAGFAVTLPRLRLALKNGELTAGDIRLLLESASAPLTAKRPTRLNADLQWSVRRARLSGARPVTFQGARGSLGADVADLDLKSTSPRKVSASAVLKQSFDLDRISVGSEWTLEAVHEHIRLLARAAANGDIEAQLPEFVLTAASVAGRQSGKKIGPLPFAASLNAAGFCLPAGKDVVPSLQNAAASISAGDFLQMTAKGALSGAVPRRAAASGSARLDLRRAMPFAAPFVPSGLKADGIVSASWDMAMPLPDKAAAAERHPLKSLRSRLSQFDTFEMALKLAGVSATVPTARGAVTVSGLRTGPDLRIVSARKGETVKIEGGISFSGLNGLPGDAGKLPVQSGSFVMNGELAGWRELNLNERIRLDPLAVTHEAELNVSRIDRLFDEEQPFSTASMIKRLDATLFASVDGSFPRQLTRLLPDLAVAGTIGSAVRADLSAGRELALRCSLHTNDLGVLLANGTRIEGLRSDIEISRVYAMAAFRSDRWTPLSAALVKPAALTAANPGAADIVGRIREDLRGDVRGSRSFSIRRVTAQVSGVPLEITAVEGDLLFSPEKTGLGFFQADLLGGTLLAGSVLDLRPEVPALDVSSSFSNLDVAYLLPKDAGKRQAGQDTEITGELTLKAPLTAEQRELFEQLRLMVTVRKIGADTIERALFSLDPYERNEQVVSQRKMLKLGSLKGLRANAVDGAFNMEGEVQIKGITVDLPKVERLRISELPLRQELTKNRTKIRMVRDLLDKVRADTLVVGPKGELTLERRNYAQ